MPTYIIITTNDNLLVPGKHYARDDSGDLHIYPRDSGDADPVVSVDADEYVAILTAGSSDELDDIADEVEADSPPFITIER
ncbi:MAG: hypothetical protein V5A34_05615 [Halapricum sp.]